MLHRPTISNLNIAILRRRHSNSAGRRCTTMPIHIKRRLCHIKHATVPKSNQTDSHRIQIPNTYHQRNQEPSQAQCLARQSV
jgi:hypothetical protein